MIVRRVLGSFWTHLLLLAAVIWGYHRFTRSLFPDTEAGRRRFDERVLPLYARYRPQEVAWETLPHLAPPVVFFLAWAAVLWVQLRWRMPVWAMLLLAVGFTFFMNISVAMMSGGPAAITHPFSRAHLEYYGDVPLVEDPIEFMREYPELNRAGRISHHAGTHPPGGVLFLWMVPRVFGYALAPASLAAIAFTSLGVVPAYLLARDLYGNEAGIFAAGMYIVTPNLVLFGATSMDGVFLVFPVLSVWLFHRALRDHATVHPGAPNGAAEATTPNAVHHFLSSAGYAMLMGLALAAGMFMTWATVCLGLVFTIHGLLALATRQRFGHALAVLLIGAATFAACYVLLYLSTGYDVIDAVFASIDRDRRLMRTAHDTPGGSIEVGFGNLFAFLIGAGLAAAVLWLRQIIGSLHRGIREGQWDLFMLSFPVGLLALSFSTLFTLETERIWMFLSPYVLTAAAAHLARRQPSARGLFWWVLVMLFAQTWLMELLLYTYW